MGHSFSLMGITASKRTAQPVGTRCQPMYWTPANKKRYGLPSANLT
jgi:hypothetical protein